MERPFPWKCGKCHENRVQPVVVDYTTRLEHDGRVYEITVPGLQVLECASCGTRMLPDDSFRTVMETLRQQAGLLTPAQIAQKREALGLSQKDFAHLIGVAPATVARWETGGQTQQRAMNDLLRAFFEVPELRAFLHRLRVEQAGVPVPPPQEPVATLQQT